MDQMETLLTFLAVGLGLVVYSKDIVDLHIRQSEAARKKLQRRIVERNLTGIRLWITNVNIDYLSQQIKQWGQWGGWSYRASFIGLGFAIMALGVFFYLHPHGWAN